MEENKTKIIMLGTGDALVTKCYNTCFVMRSANTTMLVDAGGGNGVLTQLERADISIGDIHDVYVTHSHTDHILGVIWVIRMFIQLSLAGKASGVMHIHSHEKVLRVLDFLCRNLLAGKQAKQLGYLVVFHEIQDRDEFDVGDFHLQCFDILSTKEKQFGFVALLPDGQRLACLGDEPYNEHNRQLVIGADWLMSEAFCLYRDRDKYHPYEKHHSTVVEGSQLAESLGVKNLILYHTEDHTLATRKKEYTAEAAQHFHGNIYVPDDLEVIPL
jgi:ribonuclease Z